MSNYITYKLIIEGNLIGEYEEYDDAEDAAIYESKIKNQKIPIYWECDQLKDRRGLKYTPCYNLSNTPELGLNMEIIEEIK